MIKIKDGVDLKVLEKYGFEIGQNYIDRGGWDLDYVTDILVEMTQAGILEVIEDSEV